MASDDNSAADGRNAELSHTALLTGIYTVRVLGAGETAGEYVLLLNPNSPPTANAGGPYSGDEGSAIAMSGASASDPDMDTLTYSWTVSDPLLCSFNDASLLNPELTCSDNGSFTATLEVSDGTESASSDATVIVSNVDPTVGLVSVPTEPIDINDQPVSGVSAPFTDPGTADTHTCTVDYDDGSGPQTGTVAAGTCTGPDQTYTEAGVYEVTVEVTDDDLGSLDSLSDRFERWLRDDYHLRRHGGIDMKPLDRFLADNRAKLEAFRPILQSSFDGLGDVLRHPLLKLLPTVRPWSSVDGDLKRYFRDPRVRLIKLARNFAEALGAGLAVVDNPFFRGNGQPAREE